jgi:hypothetical protein
MGLVEPVLRHRIKLTFPAMELPSSLTRSRADMMVVEVIVGDRVDDLCVWE